MRPPDRGVLLRAPSRRATALLHLLALALLFAETVYWLGQRCTGDFIGSCAPIVGLLTGVVGAVLALGLLILVVTARSGLLVLTDVLILSATLSVIVPTSLDPEIVGFSLLALVILGAIAGAITNLVNYRVETVIVVVLLILEVLLLRPGAWWFVPGVVAVLLLVTLARRGRTRAASAYPPPVRGSTG